MTRSLLLVVALALVGSQAKANILFYAGDFDLTNPNANGLANERDAVVPQSSTYQNFVVPAGQTWNVTGLFSNNLMGLSPTTADWSIRTGVSEGNGGTLIAGGTAAATFTPTGRTGFGITEYTVSVSGLSLLLGPGTYWMNVTPDDINNPNRSFNSNTFGLNSVGTDIADQEFWDSTTFGVDFTNADNGGGVFSFFSDGVIGNLAAVPEPATLAVFGLLGVGGLGYVRRRLKAAPAA